MTNIVQCRPPVPDTEATIDAGGDHWSSSLRYRVTLDGVEVSNGVQAARVGVDGWVRAFAVDGDGKRRVCGLDHDDRFASNLPCPLAPDVDNDDPDEAHAAVEYLHGNVEIVHVTPGPADRPYLAELEARGVRIELAA